MASLTQQLKEFSEEFRGKVPPDILDLMDQATEELEKSGIVNEALGVGDTVPDFQLPDGNGRMVDIRERLEEGPVVISFYRGEWCPYCNIQIAELQKHLPEIEDLGASLVAISPMKPEGSRKMAEKHDAAFDLLSDTGNKVARQFGLVFTLPETLRPIYTKWGAELPAYNGDDTFELPVSATYVIGTDGKIKAAHVDANYMFRMDPEEIVTALRENARG